MYFNKITFLFISVLDGHNIGMNCDSDIVITVLSTSRFFTVSPYRLHDMTLFTDIIVE